MTNRVTVNMQHGVADVRLNRPNKLNSLDPEMFEQIVTTGRKLAKEPRLRCVVLSGEGRAFSAGLDFGSFHRMRDESPRADTTPEPTAAATPLASPANRAQLTSHVWAEVPVPVIAAVHGYAFGGGLQIALGADIRIVSPNAQLSVMEIKWGLIPDMAGTQKLRHLVRLDVAKELTFTGRRISGTEAVELGLATRLSDTPLEDALAMARHIANNSPDATRAAKNLLDASVRLDLAEGFELEESLQRSLIGTPNQKEAVLANMEERSPDFTDPSA